MSDINLIITRQEDLKTLIYQWLDEHPQFLFNEHQELEKPLSRNDLADYLGISPVTVTDWMKKGLPYRRMHGRVFFMKGEVLASMGSFNHRKNSFIRH